ncbi:MAG: phospholipid carrier-dependent glycosyltransferase [Pyrinomonadaceae bacterium]
MLRSMLAKRTWLLLLLTIALVYFYGLGRAPFVGSDEPRYAQVAREMYERADVVTPTLAGHTWFEKPALIYWAAMAGYKFFGVSEWSARLGAACAGWLTVLLIGWTGKRVEEQDGEGASWLQLSTAAAAATCTGLIVFSRGVNFDIFITATIACALATFFAAELESDARKKNWLLAGFYAGMGAALLAKGLIGVVIPCGVVALYQLLRRRFFAPGVWKSAFWGCLITVTVAAVWYAPVIARHGWSFIDEFFIKHHFARYVSNKYHHPNPFWFYFLVIPIMVLPWTAFLLAALNHARQWNWRGDDAISKLRVFALAWVLFPLMFFSLSGSKLPGYILPALPGAALLIGERLAAFLRGEGSTRAMRVTGVLLLSLAAAGTVYALRAGELSTNCLALIFAPIIVAGVYVTAATRQRTRCVLLVAGVSLLTTMLIASCALEKAAARESVRDLLRAANARGYEGAPVLSLHNIERTAEFYAAGRLAYDETTGEPHKYEGAAEVWEAARGSGEPLLVLVPLEYVGQLLSFELLKTEAISDNGVVALIAVRAR